MCAVVQRPKARITKVFAGHGLCSKKTCLFQLKDGVDASFRWRDRLLA
jgi:hypothetical protein